MTAVYNPNNRPEADLPVVYGFVNGGAPGFMGGIALAEDGTVLGSHMSSSENWAYYDLGMDANQGFTGRHDQFIAHYPDGWKTEFVFNKEIDKHDGLKKAFELADAQEKAA